MRPHPVPLGARFRIEPVTQGDVVREVRATGHVEAVTTVQVGAEISGRIATVEVDYNDRVKQGQVLARFDRASLAAQLAQTEATLAASRAALEQARTDRERVGRDRVRVDRLHDQKVIPDSELDNATSASRMAEQRVSAAEAEVAAQQALLTVARTSLDHAVIRAPIDGVVITRNVDPGQTVASMLQTPVLFTVAADLRKMRVVAAVDESDIGEVVVHQHATFTVNAYPDRVFDGVVTEVRSSPVVVQDVVTYGTLNKMRSLLTMLGVVIGVAAVVLMQSMGRGATAYIGEAISGLGSNMLIVVPGTPHGMATLTQGVPLFTSADVEAIRRQAHDVEYVTPAGQGMRRVVVGSNNRSVMITGIGPEYFAIRSWGTSAGREFAPEDERTAALVCVIGQTVSDALFLGQSPIGKDIRVHDLACRVIGVLEAKGASAFGADQDDVVFMPFSTFSRRVMGSDRVGVLIASAVAEDRIDDAKGEINEIMRRRRHIAKGADDDFAVRDPREIQALLQMVTGLLTTVLAGVAAVSLVVGGIGLMNIMLVSVTERTREIGVRLALGARASDILMQFLVESVALSAAGGVIGIGTGLGVAYGAARLLHLPFVVPGAAGPLALAVSILVGVVFGVVPARKAARLNPLTALRFE